jgi:monofunctional glycosyltransferase
LVARLVAALAILSVLPVLILRWVPAYTSAFMLEREVGLLAHGSDPRLRHHWTSWAEISPATKLAVVASEDQNFPHHFGFDFRAIRRAEERNEEGHRLHGASTITQQVARNLFLWPGRSWLRKGLEAYYAVLLEVFWPKRRILEMYLNVCELGDGTYGVGAAASEYFDEAPSRLTRHQAALLAAVLPSPRRLHANHPSAYVEERASWIEGQMDRLGADYLTGIDEPKERPRLRDPHPRPSRGR